MGILTRTISGVLSTPEKPVYSLAHCLNHRQHKSLCRQCVDLCPGQVFSLNPKEPLHWDQCTNCGLCISACPSRCFAPNPQLQKQFTEGLNLSAPISFACFDEPAACTRRVECLAGIPWELAATLAMYTHVVFYVGACSKCKHAGRVDCLHRNLTLLRDFLGPERFAARVHILSQGRFETPTTDAAVSRRALFAGLGQSISKNVARSALDMLPIPANEEEYDGFSYRQMLADTTTRAYNNAKKALEEYKKAVAEQAAAQNANAADTDTDTATTPPAAAPALPTFGVHLPRYTKACYGCTICEKICPHGALEISPEKDGKRTIYITPWKCTGCGLCSNICPHKGLAGTHLVQVPHLNRLPLVRIDSRSCEKCGIALKPETKGNLCVVCARKAAKKVR